MATSLRLMLSQRRRGRPVPYHLPALLFAGLALSLLATLQSTVRVDEPLLQSVQSALPASYEDIGWFFNVFLSNTGIPALWALTIIGLLFLRRNDFAALFVISAVVGLVTGFLKETIDRPRPAGDFTILQFPTDPSFPSGHVMTAMAFFGLWYLVAADLLPPRAVWPVRAACLSAILLTGLSRVWAGAHWPSDVLGGFVWGSLFLSLLLMLRPLLSRLDLAAKPASAPN